VRPSHAVALFVLVVSVVLASAGVVPQHYRMRRTRPLATQVLLLQLAVIVATVVAGAAVSFWLVSAQIDEQYKERSLAIGHAVAATPDILDAFNDPDPSKTIQPIAEAIRRSAGASFVVVANQDGIRYSHPNPERIGERVSTDPGPALAGQAWVGVEEGTLGRSIRAKVPIFDRAGTVIGIVSVGFLEEQAAAKLQQALPMMTASVLLALALGVAGSAFLARRLRRQTFGLDQGEIAGLLEQREAVLHGIREGVLATDREGRITLVNDEARRLLAIDGPTEGRHIADVVPAGRVRDVLLGGDASADQVVLAGDRVLVANRMPVQLRGETVGAVVTLRDRTELEGVLRELDSERSLAQALRAQAHEFSNKLHAIGGLVELGRPDEAIRFIAQTALVHQELVDLVRERIGDPALAALLLAKAAVANERGVDFRLAPETRLPADTTDARDLVTVVGNLTDNAIEAVAGSRGGGWVEAAVYATPEGVTVRVRDSGLGVDPTIGDDVFREGFSTKPGGAHRGLGLALVRQVAERRGGWVRVSREGGSTFTALVPVAEAARA
jgi:two-component system CitB family sensor kinase